MQKFELPTERFQHVCIDLAGKLPMSEGYQYLLTIVDRFTRYVQAIPLKDATADSVCSGFLHGWVAFMGVPVYLRSDLGSCFLSQKFQALLKTGSRTEAEPRTGKKPFFSVNPYRT